MTNVRQSHPKLNGRAPTLPSPLTPVSTRALERMKRGMRRLVVGALVVGFLFGVAVAVAVLLAARRL